MDVFVFAFLFLFLNNTTVNQSPKLAQYNVELIGRIMKMQQHHHPQKINNITYISHSIFMLFAYFSYSLYAWSFFDSYFFYTNITGISMHRK